jgi:hypothetical protein
MCKFLYLLYDYDAKHPGEFVHAKQLPKEILTSRDYLRTMLYGFVEESPNKDTKKKRSGLHRITKRGKKFVEGKIKAPKYTVIYNKQFLGFKGETHKIDEFDGEFFDYAELMSR